jgi:hypothetical protein
MNTFNLGTISPALANEINEKKPYKEYQKPNGEKIIVETKEDFEKIVDFFRYLKSKSTRKDTLEPEKSLNPEEDALKKGVG